MGINLKALIAKLNDPTRGALEGAAGLCLSRTHYDIEIEHFLTKLLDSSSGDFAAIIKHFEIDKSRLTGELARSMDKLKSGNARTPAISPTVLKMLTTAWTIGSIDFNAGQVRTGFAILALASDEELSRLIREVSKEFQKINADALRKDLMGIVAMSSETTTAAAPATGSDGAPKPMSGATRFTASENGATRTSRLTWRRAMPKGTDPHRDPWRKQSVLVCDISSLPISTPSLRIFAKFRHKPMDRRRFLKLLR